MLDAVLIRLRRLLGLGPGSFMRQCGAIPFRRTAEGPEFLLITSRRGKRWIFPKGEPMILKSAPACAAQEAFEEAGVEGRIGSKSVGSYQTVKERYNPPLHIDVEMFPLEVETVHEDWPERETRQRRWANRAEASGLIQDAGLAELVRDFRISDETGAVEPDGR
jgi:8-oxo-dGTP pyrophosphatase MutT (NUDIX family)